MHFDYRFLMTTEITIDDALAVRLKKIADESHITFTQAVERAISAGLPLVGKNESKTRNAMADNLDSANSALKQILEDEDLERYRRAGG